VIALRLMPERKCQGCKKQVFWGCEAKPHKVVDEDTGEPVIDPKTKQQKVVWSNPAAIPEIFDDEETFACPRQTIHEQPREWSWLLMFYSMFKDGFLPQQGSVVDQSNKAVEVLNVMNVANQECDDEIQRREASKSKGNVHGKMG
jgi:hypothetical protein